MNRLPRRKSIRNRLTLVYTVVFFASSVSLLIASYVLIRRTFVGEFRRLNQATVVGKLEAGLPKGKVVGVDENGTPLTLADLETRITDQQAAALDATMNDVLLVLAGTIAVAGVFAMSAGWLLSGRVVRPLRTIIDTAETIAGSNLQERIRLRGPADELKQLADTFDTMLDRLERAFTAQRRFIANVAHELRTPLTTSRTLIQVALDEDDRDCGHQQVLGDLLAVNTQQARMTESLLVLARSEVELEHPERVDLGRIVTDTLASFSLRAQELGVRIDSDVSPAVVDGDPTLLSQLVSNLVENAIIYNQPDGAVTVDLSVGASLCKLRIVNSGDIIEAEDLSSLLLPFKRLRRTKAHSRLDRGHGLGLSIVSAIVGAHHGEMSLRAPSSGGLEVTVALPTTADDPVDQR